MGANAAEKGGKGLQKRRRMSQDIGRVTTVNMSHVDKEIESGSISR
jgi:hypothetical protein